MRFFTHDDTTRISEACAARLNETGAKARHCWHRGMVTYLSYPSQHDETCCYCGETVRVQDPPMPTGAYGLNPDEHGPHFPRTTTWNAASASLPISETEVSKEGRDG